MEAIWCDEVDEEVPVMVSVMVNGVNLAELAITDCVTGDFLIEHSPFIIAALRDAAEAIEHGYKQCTN